MDIFETWLNKKNESKWIKRALTDPSFNNFRKRGIKQNNPEFKEFNTPLETNADLATYGDALIKFCYSEILLGKDGVEQLSVERAKLESDKFFVSDIARHYDLIKYIDRDKDDSKMPDDYEYGEHKGNNHNPHKYIATAVEAVVGAIYKQTKDLNSIIELLGNWINLKNNS